MKNEVSTWNNRDRKDGFGVMLIGGLIKSKQRKIESIHKIDKNYNIKLSITEPEYPTQPTTGRRDGAAYTSLYYSIGGGNYQGFKANDTSYNTFIGKPVDKFAEDVKQTFHKDPSHADISHLVALLWFDIPKLRHLEIVLLNIALMKTAEKWLTASTPEQKKALMTKWIKQEKVLTKAALIQQRQVTRFIRDFAKTHKSVTEKDPKILEQDDGTAAKEILKFLDIDIQQQHQQQHPIAEELKQEEEPNDNDPNHNLHHNDFEQKQAKITDLNKQLQKKLTDPQPQEHDERMALQTKINALQSQQTKKQVKQPATTTEEDNNCSGPGCVTF